MESVDADKLLLSSLLQTCRLHAPMCCVTCSSHLMSHVTSWSSLLLHVPPLSCGGVLVAQRPAHVFVNFLDFSNVLLSPFFLWDVVGDLLE